MTKRVLCGLLLLALFASLVDAASSATKRRPCTQAGGQLLRESASAVVKEATDGSGGLVLCHRRLRRVTKIFVDADGALLSLRGTWLIAYGTDCLDSDGLEPCPYRLQVADATTGTVITPRRCAGPPCAAVESVTAGRAGRAAWCERSADGQRRIVSRPATGGSRIITTSSRIRPNSLRTSRDGRKVLWRTSVDGPYRSAAF